MICLIAFLGVLTAAQDKPPVAAVARVVTGDGARGVPPRILCEGTADLSEGSRLDLRIYYGAVEPGRELQFRSVLVRNGAFSRDFTLFPEKNLAGTYVLRISTGPDAWSIPFRIGTSQDGDRDRARVLDRLAGDIRAIVALADDADVERFRRAWSIAERSRKSPECRALRLEDVTGAGLLSLCNGLRALDAAKAAPRDPAAREARAAFDRIALKLLNRVAAEQMGGEALRRRVEDLRGPLRQACGLAGASLETARKDFTGALLDLQAKAPARHHAALVGLASAAAPLFDGSSSKEERAKALQQEVEPRIRRLQEEIGR